MTLSACHCLSPAPVSASGGRVVGYRNTAARSRLRIPDAIAALPDPLPGRAGAAAGALTRLGLLRAWCSGDAALSHSIRLRRLRGEAISLTLSEGLHPAPEEIAAWIAVDDTVQFAWAELFATQPGNIALLMPTLRGHLDALSTLQLLHAEAAHSRYFSECNTPCSSTSTVHSSTPSGFFSDVSIMPSVTVSDVRRTVSGSPVSARR